MKVVASFEGDLLRILAFLLGRLPAEQALPLLAERRPRPPCLSRSTIELIQDRLAKGCVRLLARGGWRKEKSLSGGRMTEGRLWERARPEELALVFSENSLHFLLWLTTGRSTSEEWQSPRAPMTSADLVLLFYAYAALRGTAASLVGAETPFPTHALCRLAYPADFQGVAEPPDYVPWTTGTGANILEALQPLLRERWVREEQALARVEHWEPARRLAKARDRTLTPFFTALEGAGRRDLARFLLPAAATLLAEDGPAPWGAKLQDAGPRMADRLETYRAMLFFPHMLIRLQRWDRWARTVGYVDEGYAEAQLWKAAWERWQGEALCGRAQALIRRLEPVEVE